MPDDVSAGNSKAILAGAGCCSATNKLKPAQRPRSLFNLSGGAKYNVQLTQMVEQVLCDFDNYLLHSKQRTR